MTLNLLHSPFVSLEGKGMRPGLLIFAACVLSVVVLETPVRAQDHHYCEWLLRYGIFDTEETRVGLYTVEHLRSLLRHSTARTVSDFEKDAAAFGLSVRGVFDLSFGGRSARTHFEEWKEAFLDAKTHDLLQDSKLEVTVRKISPQLMKAVMECIKNQPKGVLVGWVKPVDDNLFSLHLKYVQRNMERAKIQSVTFTPAADAAKVYIEEKHAELIKAGNFVPPTGITIAFRRSKPTTGILVAVNTTEGTKEIKIPPSESEDSLAARLTRKIIDLEQRLGKLEDKSLRAMATSQWSAFHDGENPNQKFTWQAFQTGKNRFYLSSEIPFSTPFHREPKMFLAVARQHDERGGAPPPVLASVTSVTTKGFRIQLEAIADGVRYGNVIVDYLAIGQ